VDWNPKVILPIATLGVLASVAVVLGVLRLGEVITWPARWVVLTGFAVVAVAVAAVVVVASTDADRRSEDPPIWCPFGRGWF
jgi:hypothetical protein